MKQNVNTAKTMLLGALVIAASSGLSMAQAIDTAAVEAEITTVKAIVTGSGLAVLAVTGVFVAIKIGKRLLNRI